jgi:cold-inducible RNA-binding protein
MDKKKLFVGGLPWSMSSSSLTDLFSQFGEIVDAVIISDRATGRSKGFGFITFANEADAEKAQKEMDGKDIEGRNIAVNFAKPREERSGFRRRNEGFRRSKYSN